MKPGNEQESSRAGILPDAGEFDTNNRSADASVKLSGAEHCCPVGTSQLNVTVGLTIAAVYDRRQCHSCGSSAVIDGRYSQAAEQLQELNESRLARQWSRLRPGSSTVRGSARIRRLASRRFHPASCFPANECHSRPA